MEIEHIRVGDYYIPNLTLPEEARPMGKWGRMHREYLKECKPCCGDVCTELIDSLLLFVDLCDHHFSDM